MQVILYAAQSLDGCITRHAEAGDAFTSAADKAHFRSALRACDACVLGAKTYEISKQRMRPATFPALRRVIWTRQPSARAHEAIPSVLEFTDEAPSATAARLHADGRQRCALLGGGTLNAAWLQAGLVHEVYLTVESLIFGYGTPLAGTALGISVALDIRLRLLEAKVLAPGGPLLLHYAIG
jgi:dihydrofolate reductase